MSFEKFKAVWKVKKMRLAVGFCRHFVKAALTSVSVKNIEAGNHIQVRQFAVVMQESFDCCFSPLQDAWVNYFRGFPD